MYAPDEVEIKVEPFGNNSIDFSDTIVFLDEPMFEFVLRAEGGRVRKVCVDGFKPMV
jgi:hypothetical protein